MLLKYRIEKLAPKTAVKIAQLLKVQQEFHKWAEEWARSGGKTPTPEQRPLKYFAKEFLQAAGALEWLRGHVIKRGFKPPLVFDAQLRLDNERDVSRGVFVDLPKREVRIRKWSGRRGNTIALPLSRKNVEWIEERVKEGAALVFAMAWVGRSRRNGAVALYVALTFRREVEQTTPKRLLVVDLNALHNGVAWAAVEEERRVLRRGVLRPDVDKIIRLQRQIARLDSLCAEREDGAVCSRAASAKSRLWRLLRQWEDETAKKVAHLRSLGTLGGIYPSVCPRRTSRSAPGGSA